MLPLHAWVYVWPECLELISTYRAETIADPYPAVLVLLQDKWAKIPEGYMGLAVPEMPNYFVFQGPTFPVSNGSVMGPLQAVGAYIVQIIQKMQRERIHSFAPKQNVTDAFNHHAQTWLKPTCWTDPACRSWYKNNETGRVRISIGRTQRPFS